MAICIHCRKEFEPNHPRQKICSSDCISIGHYSVVDTLAAHCLWCGEAVTYYFDSQYCNPECRRKYKEMASPYKICLYCKEPMPAVSRAAGKKKFCCKQHREKFHKEKKNKTTDEAMKEIEEIAYGQMLYKHLDKIISFMDCIIDDPSFKRDPSV